MAYLTESLKHDEDQAGFLTGLPASSADGQRRRSIAGTDAESAVAASMVKVATAHLEYESEEAIEAEIERRVRGRVALLQASLGTLDSLSGCFDNDLRTPRRAIEGLSNLLAERVARFEPDSGAAVAQVRAASQALARTLDDLMEISRRTSSGSDLHHGKVHPSVPAGGVARSADKQTPRRTPRQARMLRDLHFGSAGGVLILAAGLLLIVVAATLL